MNKVKYLSFEEESEPLLIHCSQTIHRLIHSDDQKMYPRLGVRWCIQILFKTVLNNEEKE